MRKTQVMILVLLPQALRSMLPAIVSQLVVLLKDTALGFLITYEELLRFAQRHRRQRPVRPAVHADRYGRRRDLHRSVPAAVLAGQLPAEAANGRSKKHIELEDGGAKAQQVVLVGDAGGGGAI